MKKYYYLLLVLISSCSTDPYKVEKTSYTDTICESYYDHSVKVAEIKKNKNTLNGTLSIYYSNAKLCTYKRFKNGKLNGKSQWYYETGDLKTELEFVNDTATGLLYSYYNTGELKLIINYYKEKRRGESLEYYKDQKICAYRFYNLDGNFIYEKKYDYNGNILNERGSALYRGGISSTNLKINDTAYLWFLFAFPPDCKREFLIGELNEKNEIVNLKSKPIKEDFYNEYKLVFNKQGTIKPEDTYV